jgi:hypothetical protein
MSSHLTPERGQELGHHLLKAHMFKQVAAFQQFQQQRPGGALGSKHPHNKRSLFHGLLSSSSASNSSGSSGSGGGLFNAAGGIKDGGNGATIAVDAKDASAALVSHRNVFSPNVKVSRLLLLSGASPDQVRSEKPNAINS